MGFDPWRLYLPNTLKQQFSFHIFAYIIIIIIIRVDLLGTLDCIIIRIQETPLNWVTLYRVCLDPINRNITNKTVIPFIPEVLRYNRVILYMILLRYNRVILYIILLRYNRVLLYIILLRYNRVILYIILLRYNRVLLYIILLRYTRVLLYIILFLPVVIISNVFSIGVLNIARSGELSERSLKAFVFVGEVSCKGDNLSNPGDSLLE